MKPEKLKTDYLIIGAGAMGMAFADTLLSETEDVHITIVDMNAKPGGHWNHAYPFVTLHQPSAFYGVSSRELSSGRIDKVGLNKGLGDLATGAQVSAYFDDVMHHTFLPTGRVSYFPMCEYNGDGGFTSTATGKTYEIDVRRKTVDCTFLKANVPSQHTPNFEVADGVKFMPLNDLPKVKTPPAGYVVIGGGKTGIDAILWLLEMGVAPNDVQWIVSRDAYLLDRKNTQPMPEFFEDTIGAQAGQFEAIASAQSFEDMFDRLEDCGYFVRINKDIRPSMFHGATISQQELDALRTIKNVVRMGRVSRIDKDEITLAKGTIPTSPEHIHIDCSASAITEARNVPIFQGDTIVAQTVRSYQLTFSAAFIAHIEASYPDDDAQKNQVCAVVPLPDTLDDYLRLTAAFMMNQYQWSRDPAIRAWLEDNRLDGFSGLVKNIDMTDPAKAQIMKRLRDNSMPAMAKLQQFMAERGVSIYAT